MSVFRYRNRHLTVSLFDAAPNGRIVAEKRTLPAAYWVLVPVGASADFGSAVGLSDFELR